MTTALVPVGNKKYGELVAIMGKKPDTSWASWNKILLSIQRQTHALFEDLRKYTKLSGSLGVDIYRYIWTFLPREDRTKLPILCRSIACSIHNNGALAVDLIHRSSAEYPLKFKQYLFCKRYGKTENIAHLRICDEFPRSKSDIQEIFQKLPNLQTIEFFGVGVKMMKNIAPYCIQLTHLSFNYANLVDGVLQAIAPYCENVTHLSLAKTHAVSALSFYSSAGLQTLASNCKKLSHFYFAENICLDAFPHDVASICSGLTDVSLIDCASKRNLRDLAPHCKNWTHLRIKDAYLTDAGLNEIVPHLEHLTHLRLEGVNIGADGLRALETCKNLTHVTFHQESGVGRKSFISDVLAFVPGSRLTICLSFGEVIEEHLKKPLLSKPEVRLVEKISLGKDFCRLTLSLSKVK
jgi:hypothetical protein